MAWAQANPKKAREIEDRWGVSAPSAGVKADSPNWQEQTQHNQNYKDLVIDKARNDYDLRETLGQAAESGKKKAIDILNDGFKNLGDVANATNFERKAAERRGFKNFDSPADYMSLSKSMTGRANRIEEERYDDKYATQSQLEEAMDKVKSGGMEDLEKEPEKSEQTIKDEAAVKNWEDNWAGGGIYDNIAPAKKTPGSQFLNWYMNDLFQDKAALTPEIS